MPKLENTLAYMKNEKERNNVAYMTEEKGLLN
jgi:hypothetical protein